VGWPLFKLVIAVRFLRCPNYQLSCERQRNATALVGFNWLVERPPSRTVLDIMPWRAVQGSAGGQGNVAERTGGESLAGHNVAR